MVRAPVDALMKVITYGQYAEPTANTDTEHRLVSTKTASAETLTPDLVLGAGPQHAGTPRQDTGRWSHG